MAVEGVDGVDLHVEDLLNSLLNLSLVAARVNLEGVLTLVDECVAPLRDEWLYNHLRWVLD